MTVIPFPAKEPRIDGTQPAAVGYLMQLAEDDSIPLPKDMDVLTELQLACRETVALFAHLQERIDIEAMR